MKLSRDISKNNQQIFWDKFVARAAILKTDIDSKNLESVFEAIDNMLQNYGYDFAFEITTDNDENAILSFSPEGDEKCIIEIDSLIKFKPKNIPGWKIYGRKQRKHTSDALLCVKYAYDIDIDDTKFKMDEVDDKVDIAMYFSVAESLDIDDSNLVAKTFLWHALGEDYVMFKVNNIIGKSNSWSDEELLSAEELVNLLVST